MDKFTAYISGRAFDRLSSVQVTRSMESIADSFSLSLGAVPVGDGSSSIVRVHRGEYIALKIGDETVLTGIVNQVSASDDATRASLDISGRSLAGDMVDSSAEYRKWRKHTVLRVAQDVADKFGIAVTSDIPFDPAVAGTLDRFGVEDGERAMETISRLATLRGLIVTSDPDGGLLMTRASRLSSGESIRRGVNILNASYAEDDSEQHSLYVVKGQHAGRDTFFGEDSAHGVGKAEDAGIGRYRPLVIMSETKASKADLLKRAEWERNTRAGRSVSYSVTVLGWRGGTTKQLWRENRLVQVFDPLYGMTKAVGGPLTMLITGVTYSRSAGSPTTTTLKLSMPQAYEPLVPPSKFSEVPGSGGSGGGGLGNQGPGFFEGLGERYALPWA